MKIGIILIMFVLAFAAFFTSGCRDDVEVPFPPSLAGNYTGLYSLMKIDGIDTLIDTANHISLRFTSATYNLKVDETIETDDTRFFCDSEGDYGLENGVEFIQNDGNLTNKVCTEADNVEGFFGLIQSSGTDTIRITQDVTDADTGIRSIKELRIVLTTN